MARVESTAVGGFYPTPPHLIPSIAALMTVPRDKDGDPAAVSVVDPCAGEGDAIVALAKALGGQTVSIYACEMEEKRCDRLRHRYDAGTRKHVVHGDAMRVSWSLASDYSAYDGASVVYVNAPYDFDREYKRLEERLARRFVGATAVGGIYVDVRPFYALAASADTIARHLTDVRCFRFPDGDFGVFKQIVLLGVKRRELSEPDPNVRDRILAWSESIEDMPVLGADAGLYELPNHEHTGFARWEIAPLDVTGLTSRLVPWHSTDRGGRMQAVPGVVPQKGDLLARRYPLAVAPKPAHLAAAIASGVFNGAEVRPDDPRSSAPRLRVKGVFDRDFVKAEEKHNKDGEKTGEVQIQQPKLVVTVLDVAAGSYHTLRSSAERSGSTDPAQMTTGDLLTHYGRGLMGVMLDQCPVMHDPANDTERFELPTFPRKLYRAQEEAVRALVKLLGGPRASRSERRGRAAYLLGEIGSGKSFCALATAAAIDAKRVLVMCPPHLLQGWADQARASVPWARVTVLSDVADVDAFAGDCEPGMRIAVLSRETAKLGHAYAGVSRCPACGADAPIDSDAAELARKRVRCVATASRPSNNAARIATDLAQALMLVCPRSADVNQLCRGRHRDRMMVTKAKRLGDKHDAQAWIAARPALINASRDLALEMLGAEGREQVNAIGAALLRLVAALHDDVVTERLCERLYSSTMFDVESYGVGNTVREWCRDALLLMEDPRAVAARLEALGLHATTRAYYGSSSSDVWLSWRVRQVDVASGKDSTVSNALGLKKTPLGSWQHAVDAIAQLRPLCAWRRSKACGEPLYQAIPEPRRFPLAKYLVRRYPRALDLFISDEAHESANADSAQSIAAHRIVATGVPTLALTGSVMNGYAASLFANQWALDPEFRAEFQRSDLRAFNRRYGYIKVLVQETDKDNKIVEWGSQSERRTTTKEIGNAPGVLPLFTLRYLLRMAVTLHKADLALDLPGNEEIVEYVEADGPVLGSYRKMLDSLKKQIKQDRFDPLLAGKLFGQMSEIPSYLDRATCDTGNRADGSYEVAYPTNDELEGMSGAVIARADGLPSSAVLPKERRMLDVIQREFSEGRRVMIFAWHEAVLPRLQALVERELSEPCALLRADKVQAAKRQGWIDKEVIGKKRRVLVVNPVAVQTGLNNLVWFHSEWWHQNPACNPVIYRQAVGRVDRIGKTLPTRIFLPVYQDTAQALTHKLLMHKVGVSLATDGLDAESALQAAGVGSAENLDAFGVGRALLEMMDRGEPMRDAPRAAVPRAEPANEVTPCVRQAVQLGLFG